MKKTLAFVFSSAMMALAVAGCHKQSVVSPTVLPPPPPQSAGPSVATPEPSRSHAVIYVVNPKATGDQDPLMPRTISLRDPKSPARESINALLHSSKSPLAAGTALRGLTIEDGLATLDFSQSPVNETGGEGGQGDALTALSRTLGQFPEISRYQIEVKGRIVTSFGEFTTDGPIEVVRPETVQQARRAPAGEAQ